MAWESLVACWKDHTASCQEVRPKASCAWSRVAESSERCCPWSCRSPEAFEVLSGRTSSSNVPYFLKTLCVMFTLTIAICYDHLMDHSIINTWISVVDKDNTYSQRSRNGAKFPLHKNACHLFGLHSWLLHATLLLIMFIPVVENMWLYQKPLDFYFKEKKKFWKFLKFPLPDHMSQTFNSNEHASLWAHKYCLCLLFRAIWGP